MSNVNDNPERDELGFGKAVEDAVGLSAMTAEEFKEFIHPLTFVDAAKFFGASVVYLKKIAHGDRPAKDFGKDRQDVLDFLKTSPDAVKSRQQFRNAVGYKAFVKLVGVSKYKCRVCLYPASESIYKIPLCESCVRKFSKNKEK